MNLVSHKIIKKKLEFTYPFVISHGARTHTDAIFLCLEIQHQNHIFFAYGEAAIPPYLTESVKTVEEGIQKYHWETLINENAFQIELKKLQELRQTPCFATILEMAFLDALSQVHQQTLRVYLGLGQEMPQKFSSYTISFDTDWESTLSKLSTTSHFQKYKIKITGDDDLEKVFFLSQKLKKDFMIDANQAFHNPKRALDAIHKLTDMGCTAIEQPLEKDRYQDAQWLKSKSPIPIIADEAFQTHTDLNLIERCYHGLNIKTLKVGGVLPGLRIIEQAKKLGLVIQIGCMSESSLGCTYGAVLIDHADYIDLDGPLLIKNDPFQGICYSEQGEIILPKYPGIGAKLKTSF
jgi:L-alanine-DL-glutamate epimerase-like enolase superfamily enzyme